MKHACFVSCGSYLPERIVTNDDMAEIVETSDEWIKARTGIHQRHFADEGELTSDLGTKAAQQALERAGLKPEDIDLIICATTTPDLTFPSTASIIQRKLGVPVCQAFDIQAVCSGFIYGLSTINAFLSSGQAKRALLIGAETFSRILNFEDRGTCVLFGDGAGAVIFESLDGEADLQQRGIIDTKAYCDGTLTDLLYVDGGVSTSKTAGHVRMSGQEVFKHAVEKMGQAVVDMMAKHSLSVDDLDLFVPHQANQRILNQLMRNLKLPKEKMISCMALHANTSAASIPLALNLAVESGRAKKGDLLMMEALGGGLTWGTALLRL
jgi:3-oxoacyl-[acyl-carrier-protein] synthase-3